MRSLTGNRVTDDVLEEDLENAAGLLVYEARDALDSSTTRETADRGLGDALNVVTKLRGRAILLARGGGAPARTTRTHDLAVALSSSLAEALAALSTS